MYKLVKGFERELSSTLSDTNARSKIESYYVNDQRYLFVLHWFTDVNVNVINDDLNETNDIMFVQ